MEPREGKGIVKGRVGKEGCGQIVGRGPGALLQFDLLVAIK